MRVELDRISRRGQTLVEFAIILPFLFLLLAAIVDFGFYLYDYIGTQSAIRAGAQAAVQASSSNVAVYSVDQIKKIMKQAHGPVSQLQDGELDVTTKANDAELGGTYTSVTLSIAHVHAFLLPVFLLNRSPTITIRARIKSIQVPGLAP